LLKGGALEQAGQWDKARAELERANQLAPDQPVILNYLGYAQIERRQNIDEALALIQKASGLKPDDPAIKDSLGRSEEHTSELQSLMRISYAVFCLKTTK